MAVLMFSLAVSSFTGVALRCHPGSGIGACRREGGAPGQQPRRNGWWPPVRGLLVSSEVALAVVLLVV